jgi:hypothetical protein
MVPPFGRSGMVACGAALIRRHRPPAHPFGARRWRSRPKPLRALGVFATVGIMCPVYPEPAEGPPGTCRPTASHHAPLLRSSSYGRARPPRRPHHAAAAHPPGLPPSPCGLRRDFAGDLWRTSLHDPCGPRRPAAELSGARLTALRLPCGRSCGASVSASLRLGWAGSGIGVAPSRGPSAGPRLQNGSFDARPLPFWTRVPVADGKRHVSVLRCKILMKSGLFRVFRGPSG